MEIKNAKIESTQLGKEDHGIPTCFITLDYGSAGQGFGGYDLRYYGIEMIIRILEVVDVEKWEDLVGKYVRVKIEDGLIQAIGHITKDSWYNPKAEDKKNNE